MTYILGLGLILHQNPWFWSVDLYQWWLNPYCTILRLPALVVIDLNVYPPVGLEVFYPLDLIFLICKWDIREAVFLEYFQSMDNQIIFIRDS